MNSLISKPFISALLLIFLLVTQTAFSQNTPPYKDARLNLDQRVEDLLLRMTLEEKFWQMFMLPYDGTDSIEKFKQGVFGFQFSTKGQTSNEAGQLLNYSGGNSAYEMAQIINTAQKYFVEKTRLGIPIIPFDEALHGLVREGATAFPQAIGLAATWDTTLMAEVAGAIAVEANARGIRQILSPVLNIASDVRWGRTEETYGEDPFLVSQMGFSFISPFEKKGIITTPKHIIANVGDGGRDSYPIHFNERLLEEVYFPPFKTAIQKSHARSVMTAYNSYNGTPCTANDWLINEKVKKQWGFTGFVISDASATGGANVLHYTSKNYAESTEQAIDNGLDVIFQTAYTHYPLFYEAFKKGMIRKEAIDSAVRRVLRAKFELGLFDHPYTDTLMLKQTDFIKEHRKIAKKAALESIVLLKNENQVLPLSKKISSVAVIGDDAIEGRLGGYSRNGKAVVNILQGINMKIDSSRVHYLPGCGRDSGEFVTVPATALFHVQNNQKAEGLLGQYFNNITLQGIPALTRNDPQINFQWTLFSPDQKIINFDYYSVRWTGKLVAPETGKFKIGITGDDGYRLYLNDSLIIDNWRKQTVQTISRDYFFKKGSAYTIKIEFFETVGNVRFSLVWNVGIDNHCKKKIRDAVELVKKSDVAIVVAGIEEGEFRDRAYLSLPGYQEELIREIAATGKPVVVVLVGGSAITMTRFINEADAIVDVWYPGDEGGNAVADVLFGDYNPAGRLPITFPVHESQLPLTYYHKPTGRGDDYLNLTGKPLFPFGYGLSYTTFEYSNMQFTKPEIRTNDSVTVTFFVKNTGKYDGDEVVQLYIKDLLASVARPMMELKGFQRIHIKAGEKKEVKFILTPDLFSMLNKNMETVVEPGDFRIMAGTSSIDIRLRKIFTSR
ncbi:MAG: glycoside hydrolase family 3 C-terminal domain-containing protein [Bacteroidales bacterium]|nr:glycoside hydrolase family 3 C-terminal domain-containing protein [Bacteroidales bacterium]